MDVVAPEIEGYKILKKISDGELATVYEATQESSGDLVAVKVLLNVSGEDSIKLIRNEISILKHLSEVDSVAKLLDSNPSVVGSPYLVTEFIKGRTFESYYSSESMDWESATDMVIKAAESVIKVHDKNVIHRSIQPSNIIKDESGNSILVDFKSACLSNAKPKDYLKVLSGLAFLAPEVILGDDQNGFEADVYGLGATLWSLLGGRAPFQIVDIYPKEAAEIILSSPVEDLRSKVPADICTVIETAMAKKPEQRYSSVSEFLNDLIKAKDSEPEGSNIPVPNIPPPVTKTPEILPGTLTAKGGERNSLADFTDNRLIASAPNSSSLSKNNSVSGANNIDSYIDKDSSSESSEEVLSPTVMMDKVDIKNTEEEKISNTGKMPAYVDKSTPNNNLANQNQSETVQVNQSYSAGLSENIPSQKDEEMFEVVTAPVNSPEKKFPFLMLFSAVILTIIACVAVFALLNSSLIGKEKVGNYVGMNIDEVENNLKDSSFIIQKSEDRKNGSKPGEILEQSPPEGAALESGEVLNLVVSLGPELKKLPEVENVSVDSAIKLLEDAGFKPGKVLEQRESPDVPKDYIVELVVDGLKADDEYPEGQVVDFVTSNGKVTIPQVTAESFDEVLSQGLKLKVVRQQEFSNSIEPGQLIRVEPPVGSVVDQFSVVRVYLAIEQPQGMIPIPNVAGQSLEQAVTILQSQGFQVNLQTAAPPRCRFALAGRQKQWCDDYNAGLVYKYGPEGQARAGSQVRIYARADVVKQFKDKYGDED